MIHSYFKYAIIIIQSIITILNYINGQIMIAISFHELYVYMNYQNKLCLNNMIRCMFTEFQRIYISIYISIRSYHI